MTARRRKKRKAAGPVRKTDRRWRVPPPLTHGPEPLEGGTILEELPTPLGALLWAMTRDVRLWTATPAEERDELFSAEATTRRAEAIGALEVKGDLERALRAISMVVTSAGDADVDDLAAACRAVARWAEEQGLPGIALAYTQSVALLHEADPRVAYEVGQLARWRGEDARAETWFRRAVMLARQNGDWTSYSLAFVGLGDLYRERGNYATARKLYVRATRASHRHSLHAIEGMALHGMFTMAIDGGDEGSAEELAAAALAAYGPRHERLPDLALSLARHWLARGRPAAALQILRAVLPRIEDPDGRSRAESDLQRATSEAARIDGKEGRERGRGAEEDASAALASRFAGQLS